MNRQLLEQTFSEDQVRYREGSFGQTLAYVPGHVVIERLNQAFESLWSFEITAHEIHQDEVIVIGRLSAEDITKTQFGSSKITRVRETGEMVSLADDLKAAATDAIKKAASLFGIGLHLYADKPVSQNSETGGRKGDGGESSHSGNGGNGNGRLTSKQHNFLLKLANERGISKKELNDQCVEIYGSVVDYLTRQDASAMIESMIAQ